MTTITNPTDHAVQAIFLKMHISIMNKGMTHSQLRKGDVITKINNILGTNFSNRQGVAAEAAIRKFVDDHVPAKVA